MNGGNGRDTFREVFVQPLADAHTPDVDARIRNALCESKGKHTLVCDFGRARTGCTAAKK
jgi:hypothetical protein